MNEKLYHTDDAAEQLRKMLESQNRTMELTKQLIELGKKLNELKGQYAEIKAKIRLEQEIRNTLKVSIRAEANAI